MKIDIDKPCDVVEELMVRSLLTVYDALSRRYGLPRVVHWELQCSQSGNAHLIAWLDRAPRDCIEQYIVARLLGDDPMRSILNYARCVNLGDAIDILFARKERLERGGDSGETG